MNAEAPGPSFWPSARSIAAALVFASLSCTWSPQAQAGAITTQSGRKVFLRGIGWSPWHATEHWHHSQKTRDLDLRLLKEAHINCLRTWGPATRKSIEESYRRGFYRVPTAW